MNPRSVEFLRAYDAYRRGEPWPVEDLPSPTGKEVGEAIDWACEQIERMQWRPIETAPKDGTLILVWAAPAHGLPGMVSFCAWHENAGFCVDELRVPTHWIPMPPPPGETK